MAKTARQPLDAAARDKKELELARLRRLRASLPPEKRAAGRHMDQRMQELESALKNKGGGGNPVKAVLLIVGALIILAASFIGIMAAGELMQH